MAGDPDFIRGRVNRFYARYGDELNQIAELLRMQLQQLAFAYTLNNHLPPQAVKVSTRVKTESSLLRKLEGDGWPEFYLPTEVIGDLIGARIACWFIDDCHAIVETLQQSSHVRMADPTRYPVKDFISDPKSSGYRAIHLFGELTYDAVDRDDGRAIVTPRQMLCEIQVRSRLQDSWADITHDFHYKAKAAGVDDPDFEQFLADIASRLSSEDEVLMRLRDTYRRLVDDKTAHDVRVGFIDS